MDPINEAIEEINSLGPGETFTYTAIAKKYGVLPPTREMVQNFASAIAKEPVSESWVTRFLTRHGISITPRWSTGMDRDRHHADLEDKYQLFFQLLIEVIEKYDIEPRHTYNMDEKGFLIRVIRRSKRIFSKAI
ncbi:uncharacterized protein CC84DRAFT_1169909 [Paraphaeosphaeria sporulosa]|uniref:HTH CENPB-type domain-containing protein n=1 Tax=Paraphaeosphaeria sporulosa TaxID=1460663 RepID=A0A177BVR5_9PLEO|nr:uncharacterized protein CC84DRAFT_1169909 [Paraphaeosphaeria sporulosa]OAF98758.1 hypothetical protein CC84DRAFT_1169909 [Paraphaeosphaeria sporulosa]